MPSFDPECPFCPGNEDETPPETMRVPDPDGDSWSVRVVPNRYPALGGPAGEAPDAEDVLRRREPARGRHEVLIETPVHNRSFAELDDRQLGIVMRVYLERFSAATADPDVRHVIIFRNDGEGAGASIPHPHCQLVGLPLVPPQAERRARRARAYASRHGRSLLLDMVTQELEDGTRVIAHNQMFATFVPFAARYPYELWIVPRFGASGFEDTDESSLTSFGSTLRDAVARLRRTLQDPDYNFVLHSHLADDDRTPMPWFAQLFPRLTTPAGLELGAGVHLNITAPEDAARHLRE